MAAKEKKQPKAARTNRSLKVYLIYELPRWNTWGIEMVSEIREDELISTFKMKRGERNEIFNDPAETIALLQFGYTKISDGRGLLDQRKDFEVLCRVDKFDFDEPAIFIIESGNPVPAELLTGQHQFVSMLVPDPRLPGTWKSVYIHGQTPDESAFLFGTIQQGNYTWQLYFPAREKRIGKPAARTIH